MSVSFGLSPSEGEQWTRTKSKQNHSTPFHDYGSLSEDFHTTVVGWVTKQLTRSVRSTLTLHQQGQCIEGAFFKSMEPHKIMPNVTGLEQQFLESLFLIESSYCLPNIELKRAYDVFMSEGFRTDVMPQVEAFSLSKTQHCVTSSGVTGILLPSYYCSNHHTKTSENHIIVYSTLKNATNDVEHQPLYLRDEIIILSQIGTDIAFYRATFSRSQDLGMTTKYLLKSTVSSSQSNIRDGYYEWLQQ
jgi:hypothetical protein